MSDYGAGLVVCLAKFSEHLNEHRPYSERQIREYASYDAALRERDRQTDSPPPPPTQKGALVAEMPVFTIKAKDALAVPTVRRYKQLCEEFGLAEQARQVQFAIEEIEDWQRAYIDETKLPDHHHRPTLPLRPPPPA